MDLFTLYLVVVAALALTYGRGEVTVDYKDEVDLTIISILRALFWPVSAAMFIVVQVRRVIKRGSKYIE